MNFGNIRTLLFGGVAVVGAFAFSPGANALDLNFGSVKASLDTTVGIQAGIRTSAQDCSFIAVTNGGCYSNASPPGHGYTFGTNSDDGDINTKQWQPYTTQLQISQELQLDWQNYGGFFRWKGYYDYWGSQQVGTNATDFGPVGVGPNGGNLGNRPLTDGLRGDSATRSLNGAGFGARLLDAFVYGSWDVGDNPLNVRLGNQVVNWGESLFIQGGINSYLGYDVTALRTPGSELKNAVTPMPAIYASIGLPDGFSLEGWYEFLWNPVHLDPVGTFFSTSDYLGPGGNYQVLGGEYNQQIAGPGGLAGAVAGGKIMLRGDDDEPSNQGQFGAKVGYYADWLNDGTDLGLYFTHFHSAYPILAYTAPTSTLLKSGQAAFASQRYLAQYAPNIQMIGASFNTMLDDFLGGTALAGEIAYSPNMAFQISSATIMGEDLGVPSSGGNGILTAPGGIIPSYKRKTALTGQLQTTSTLSTTSPFTDFIGADLTVLLANVGFQYLPNTSSSDQLSINRADQYNFSPLVDSVLGSGQCPGSSAGRCAGAQYASSFSWGYRLMISPQYNNAFGTSLTVSPLLVWSHDVTGYSAGPIGPGFIAGVKKVSVGFNASYLSAWNLNMQWTSAFGNKYRNYAYDKDFASMTLSYSF
ncbi:MAG: DUF1302 domain-containing protein [Parvibaculaceae bacterium]|nr:DUF1302 domain-containing protein [Parvibaculaceae bacterium]